jgi:4-hydroxybenzoyl-CoA thioesterase/acyl-CoA thioester hydrolase
MVFFAPGPGEVPHMSEPFHTTRRVEFCHTDAAGIVHFAAFFEFMEQAEHELLRSRGLSVLMSDDAGPISWPRVAAQCQFQSAARFEDVLQIEVRIGRLGKKSITYAFQFRDQGREVAEGRITAVCCRMSSGAPPEAIEIPPWFREKLTSRL